jgi:hypothetical protein
MRSSASRILSRVFTRCTDAYRLPVVTLSFFFGSSTLADQSSPHQLPTRPAIRCHGQSAIHRLKLGGEYRFSQVNFYFNAFSRGQMIYGDTVASELGQPRFRTSAQASEHHSSVRVCSIATSKSRTWNGFIQDRLEDLVAG